MSQIQILTTTANIKDVCWLLTRHYRTPDQSVPAWAGVNQLTITNKQQVTFVSFLPIINASAHELTHEEADTRIILHATAAYDAWFERVIIASRDSVSTCESLCSTTESKIMDENRNSKTATLHYCS